jgi:hypothetical protein
MSEQQNENQENKSEIIELKAKELFNERIFSNTDKELELSEEEKQEAPASAGVRGQIKKILRVFKDDIYNLLNHEDKVINQNIQLIQSSMANFQNNIVKKVEELDKKYMNLYSGLVRQVLIPIESTLFNTDTTLQATIEYFSKKLYAISKECESETEYIAKVKNEIETLRQSIDAKIKEEVLKKFNETNQNQNNNQSTKPA